jgi:hypothetical protein
MNKNVYLCFLFWVMDVCALAQTASSSYYVDIHFASPPGVYCDYIQRRTRLIGTISSKDGTGAKNFSVYQTESVRVNLSGKFSSGEYKLSADVETFDIPSQTWTKCTSVSGTGTASLGANHQVPQYIPSLGMTSTYVSFDYCWTPYERQSFQITGGGYDEYLTIYNVRYLSPSPVWEVSLNSQDWKPITMPPAKGGALAGPTTPGFWGVIPGVMFVGTYYQIDRDRLRSVLGSNIYDRTIYFRSSYSNVCFTTTSAVVGSNRIYAFPPAVAVTSHEDARCKGESTGTATLDIQHPDIDRFVITCHSLVNQAYDFQIPEVYRGSYTITGLRAGKWEFKIENNRTKAPDDNYNWGAAPVTVDAAIGEPELPLLASIISKKYNGFDVSCTGSSNGEITGSATGGNGNYTYTWSHDPGIKTIMASGLKAGIYTFTATDYKGCTNSKSLTLVEPTKLAASISSTGGKGAYGVSCWDKSDGALQASATGGAPGYSYTWSTNAMGNSISSLPVNSYTVTVKDANSCTAQSSITLTAPPKIDFAINELKSLTCPGDYTAVLEAKPVASTIIGTADYKWSTGEIIATIEDKGAGTYSVTVFDDQGCSTTKSKTLIDPPANTVSISPLSSYNGSYIKCNGDSNGSLTALVKDENSNTVTAQNYSWTNENSVVSEGATASSVDNLSEGQYKVVITYRNQCKAEATYFLSDPEPVTVAVSTASNYNGQAISCYNMTDGKLHAVATGGTGTHSYSWNTGATGSLLTGVGAGAYTSTVTDVNGCIGTQTMALQNPEPVRALIADVSDYSGYGVSCYGSSDGAITAEGAGGTGVYTYSWSNGKTTASINSLTAGNYTVTVSDNNGCKQPITQAITSPAALSLTVAKQKKVSCFGGNDGTIELQSSGGAGNYTYSKDSKTTWQTGNIFNDLSQGSYTIILHDANGCEKSTSTTLTQPTKINISFKDIQPAFCSNPTGTATAVVNGGVSGYDYSWQDSKNNVVDADAILSNVKSGIYTLLVTDNNACPMSNMVAITSNDGAKSTYTANAAKCFDSSDGSALITITEGDGPFVIEWPNGQSDLKGTDLKKGIYNVLITDSHNCTVVQAVDISAPDALALNVKSEAIPTCNGVCDGQLALEATGGVGGYIYQWNSQTGATQTQLCAAIYPVVLKDANGCVLNQEVELKHPEPIQITVVNTILPTCKDGCDGTLEVEANGGNGGYNYTWTTGGNSNIKTGICPGDYTVAVTDVKGCKGESTVTLSNTPALPLDLGGGVTLCVGQKYTLDAGTNWKNIVWGSSTGLSSTDQKVIVNEAGRYWVEVYNDKGCMAQDTFLLETSYDLLRATFLLQDTTFVGDTVVVIDISWPLPEKVEWNYPTEMTLLQDEGDLFYGKFRDAGIYEVSLAAHLGECFDKMTKSILVLDEGSSSEGGRLGYEEYVKQFTLYPNPNNGAFHVGIELTEEMPITVSIWHAPSGILIRQVQKSGNNQYTLYFDLKPVTSGTYVLRLDFEKGKKYIRFVVD